MLALGFSASVPAVSAAATIDQTLVATPLVLKDGRIAEVSIHTVPFSEDEVAPAGSAKNALNDFAQSIATDCFLTAQIIGHVDKEEISGRETADIHRLARARADTIQSALIDNGLPVTAIASVWDWRFMIQQARATLWVFRLTAGEDCEDLPFGAESVDDVVASNKQPSPATNPPAAAPSSPAAPIKTAALPKLKPEGEESRIVPASRPKAASATTPFPASSSPSPAASSKPTVSASQKPAAPKELTTTPVKADKTVVAALDQNANDNDKGSTKIAQDGALEIIYATNSSYFPAGTGDQLRAFLKTLDSDKAYLLRIQTSIDATADVSGVSENEASRYNAWLAERRAKRVEEWLQKNGEGLNIELKPTFVETDSPRQVRVEPTPLG